jgi:hypothetical protein
MKRIIVLFAICQCLQTPLASASAKLTNRERAILYVISEEAKDYALEARADVCVGFSTDLAIPESKIFLALRERGLKFHPSSWCNDGPRGVEISITMPNKDMPPETYHIMSGIGDNDPIRLYGDHFATLLRKSDYVIRCKDDLEPTVQSYKLLCCERGKSQTVLSPN